MTTTPNNDTETITIPKSEYEKLLKAERNSKYHDTRARR